TAATGARRVPRRGAVPQVRLARVRRGLFLPLVRLGPLVQQGLGLAGGEPGRQLRRKRLLRFRGDPPVRRSQAAGASEKEHQEEETPEHGQPAKEKRGGIIPSQRDSASRNACACPLARS